MSFWAFIPIKLYHKKIHFSIFFRNYGIFSVDAGILGKNEGKNAKIASCVSTFYAIKILTFLLGFDIL